MSSKRLLLIPIAAVCLAALPKPAAAHDEPVVGSLIGAGIGAAIGGPPGAAVGAVIGAGIGSHAAHETDHGTHAQRRHRHYSRAYIEERRYVAPARYNGNGTSGYTRTTVHCEPDRAHYRPRIVHRDDRAKVVKTVATQQKYRKVCRYVPVG